VNAQSGVKADNNEHGNCTESLDVWPAIRRCHGGIARQLSGHESSWHTIGHP